VRQRGTRRPWVEAQSSKLQYQHGRLIATDALPGSVFLRSRPKPRITPAAEKIQTRGRAGNATFSTVSSLESNLLPTGGAHVIAQERHSNQLLRGCGLCNVVRHLCFKLMTAGTPR
jgi:hypothetical protein